MTARLTALFAMVLLGCSPSDPDRDPTGDSHPNSGTPTTTSSPLGTLEVHVLDLADGAVVDAPVTLLTETTDRFQPTDPAGIARFASLEARDYLVVLSSWGDAGRCSPVAQVRVDGPSQRIDLQQPDPPTTAPIGDTPAEVQLAPGLHLTVDTTQLDPALFADPIEAVGACSPTSWPEIPGTSEVLGLWYLWPPESKPTAPLPVRIDDAWSRPGAHLWSLQVDGPEGVEPTWHDEGLLQPSADGLIGSLTRYNAVAVVVPAP